MMFGIYNSLYIILDIDVEATAKEVSRYASHNQGSTIPVVNVHGAITAEWYPSAHLVPSEWPRDWQRSQYHVRLHLLYR